MSPDFMSSKNAGYLGIIDVTEVIPDDHSSGTSGIPKGSQRPSHRPTSSNNLTYLQYSWLPHAALALVLLVMPTSYPSTSHMIGSHSHNCTLVNPSILRANG